MQKTLFVTHWPGGGVWGLAQLVQAAYTEEQTGMRMADLSDLHISSSIGAAHGNCLLVPSDEDPSVPKFQARDMIEPFKECASELFGKDGIQAHYTHTVKHDLARRIKGENSSFLRRGMARFLDSGQMPIHKPHEVLGSFLDAQLGDTQVNQLMGSSITLAHHMETTSRVCFAHLDPELFDAGQWDGKIMPNHGGDTRVQDAIMASTAAPTVFNAHAIGNNHYVDFDRLYSPLIPLELAHDCLRQPHPDLLMTRSQPKMLKMSCGLMFGLEWDYAKYADHGPLAMYGNMTTAMAVDQQRMDHYMLEKRLGRHGLTTIGAELSALTSETETMPSLGAFNGNLSNMGKIESFAHDCIVSKREEIMRYADMVTETRAREGHVDAFAAFNPAANCNTAVPEIDTPTAASELPSESWGFGLGRLFGRVPT